MLKEIPNWIVVKDSIKKDLLNRGLSDPSIRLRAINSVENLLLTYIEELKSNPLLLIKELDKSQIKQIISLYKTNKRLNGAEESIVNEIYYKMEVDT